MCTHCLHTDIDECVTGTSECNQICSDTNGSYVCDCYSGYVLLSDGKTCDKDTSKQLHENDLKSHVGCPIVQTSKMHHMHMPNHK